MSNITNSFNVVNLINKHVTYTTFKSGNTCKYIPKSIDRIGDAFVVCKVIDKSDHSKTGQKQVWKTMRFDGISSLSHCGALVR